MSLALQGKRTIRHIADGRGQGDEGIFLRTQPPLINRVGFQYALHIVARFGKGNLLDPVYGVDMPVAGIPKLADPLVGPPRAGIVGGKCQGQEATIAIEHPLQIVPTQSDVVVRIARSEEHTSELQSRGHLVCRLLLEKKKHIQKTKWTAKTATE